MLTLIGVALLSGELAIAVEGPAGCAEQRFECTVAGVKRLMEFVFDSLGPGEPAIQFVVGPIERQSECAPFFATLAQFGISNAAVAESELEDYRSSNGSPQTVAVSVAEAFRQKHARRFKRR